MLKKLRLKFIGINMIIVTLMLGVIFGLLYYLTADNLQRESLRMMENAAMSPVKPEPPNDRGGVRLPCFSVIMDRNGEPIQTEGRFFDLSDRQQLRSIVQTSLEAGTQSGMLKDYKLRFLRTESPMGTRIVYADMTSEIVTLRNLIRNFFLIGGLSFLAFLGISILLAKWAVRPVDEAWQQQKQFVADASHELKTPLTVIMTDAELLRAPDCPESDREPLSANILTMSMQMRGLVENLLDLARLDNGSVREKMTAISVSDIVTETVMIYEPIFFEKGLPLHCEIQPDITVHGYEAQLKQLVGILLDNASKYAAPEGHTLVRLARTSRRRCMLEVGDQGDPIADEDLKRIFERFYRADKARTMNHSYGLGLSIAKRIAEESGGRIRAESADGWNRFFMEIPCEEIKRIPK